jgi:hypothetical protein
MRDVKVFVLTQGGKWPAEFNRRVGADLQFSAHKPFEEDVTGVVAEKNGAMVQLSSYTLRYQGDRVYVLLPEIILYGTEYPQWLAKPKQFVFKGF